MDVTATRQEATAAATAATRRTEAGGKSLPPGGQAAPAARQPARSETVEKAIEQIRSFLRDSQRQLNFERDEATGRTVIRVIDPHSGEVIRQMPPEEILNLAAMLHQKGFHTVDELA
jgi:flagellar protein FlaG